MFEDIKGIHSTVISSTTLATQAITSFHEEKIQNGISLLPFELCSKPYKMDFSVLIPIKYHSRTLETRCRSFPPTSKPLILLYSKLSRMKYNLLLPVSCWTNPHLQNLLPHDIASHLSFKFMEKHCQEGWWPFRNILKEWVMTGIGSISQLFLKFLVTWKLLLYVRNFVEPLRLLRKYQWIKGSLEVHITFLGRSLDKKSRPSIRGTQSQGHSFTIWQDDKIHVLFPKLTNLINVDIINFYSDQKEYICSYLLQIMLKFKLKLELYSNKK